MSFKGDGQRPVVKCGPSRAKQEFRSLTNINEIVRRARRTGYITHVQRRPGAFLDVSQVGDFRSVLARIRAAQEAFERLPASLRGRFNDDPAALVEFIQDRKNYDEAVKLGLIEKPKESLKSAEQPVAAASSPVAASAAKEVKGA